MKIVAINGSHRGENGNTDVMVSAFLKGAEIAGAEIANIFLMEKDIKHCRACKTCWFSNPGKCIIKDDMADIISVIEDADIRILATPLYFDNISSMLNAFMNRLIMMASPYWEKDKDGECRHLTMHPSSKLIMIANCGYPERTHFQVISKWIQRIARNINTEVIGEIYASQGALLSSNVEEIHSIISIYCKVLEDAGKEVVTDMKLSEKTKKLLEQKFISDEIYIQEVKKYADNMFKK